MTRKKANPTPAAEAAAEVKATPDQAAQADIAPDDAEKAAPPPEVKPLAPQPSGEAPTEDAEAVLVKTRTAERFYRCGLEFDRAWRLVARKDLSEPNWQRLLAEPHLEVQGVVLTAEEHAA